MQPLRILMLMNRVPWPLNDGGAIGAFNFVKGYAEAGCRVTVLAMNTTRHYVEPMTAHDALDKYADVHLVDVDNRIKPLDALRNLLTNKSYVIQRFVSQKYAMELQKLLANSAHDVVYGGRDVVHVDGLPPAAYAHVYKAFDVTVSMRAHNVEHVIWERIASQERNPLKRWYLGVQAHRLQRFELDAIDGCDVVMAISNEDQDTIRRLRPNARTLVVPAGMDVPDVAVNTNFSATDLFSIGAFDWMPNLQGTEWFAKSVWPTIHARFPDITISVAGKRMPASIEALATPSFRTVGEVADAKQFMLSHGIMVVPIISGSGIRIKILEGMALGKTIIATTIGAEGLGLTHNENILIADTPDEWIACIERCMADTSFCQSIGVNAHRFAYEHYRNSNIFEKLIAYYRGH